MSSSTPQIDHVNKKIEEQGDTLAEGIAEFGDSNFLKFMDSIEIYECDYGNRRRLMMYLAPNRIEGRYDFTIAIQML